MKWLLALLVAPQGPKPVFAEDENAEREMRIAELKWLLREIAVPSALAPAGNDNRGEGARTGAACCA